MSLLSLNQTEKIDHEVQASACRIESLSEQWLTFQMNEFSPYLGMTPFRIDRPDGNYQLWHDYALSMTQKRSVAEKTF
ncbi:hypothetical protein ACM7GB_32920 [Pseudomonas aeruginosa]